MKLILTVMTMTTMVTMLSGFFWSRPTWEAIDKLIAHKFPEVKSISTDELKSKLDKQDEISIVDVREKEEYQVSHIPAAHNIVVSAEVPFAKESSIVVYCSVGIRSASFAEKLEKRGYLDVKNLTGSIFEWANKGYPLEQAGKPATKVHPYNNLWGLLLRAELRRE